MRVSLRRSKRGLSRIRNRRANRLRTVTGCIIPLRIVCRNGIGHDAEWTCASCLQLERTGEYGEVGKVYGVAGGDVE
jgi:hypothetical protein